jgi:hypothetical protein
VGWGGVGRGMLEAYGLAETGLGRVIADSGRLLHLRTFCTVGTRTMNTCTMRAIVEPARTNISDSVGAAGF